MVMQIYKDWEDGYDMKLADKEWWVKDWDFFMGEFLCCDFIKEWSLEEFMAELQKDIDENLSKDELRKKWLISW